MSPLGITLAAAKNAMKKPSVPETSEETSARPLDRAKLASALLSSALDCIIVSDAKGTILEFNEAAEQTFGWSRSDVLGRAMDETIVPHHHREAHRKGMERYLAGGAPRVIGRRIEIEALHSSGRVLPVELSISETEMDGSKYFVATLRDISEQKKAAARLQETQATLSAIFDNIPAALYLRDCNDTLVMMNNWGANFLRRDIAEMIGQPMSKFREPQNMARVQDVDNTIIKTGQPETHEFTYHLPDGDRTGLMTFFPVKGSNGEVSHIGGMLLDVTELHKAQVELQKARASLQAFFDHAPVGVFINEIGSGGLFDQTVEFANDMVGKPYGLKGSQIVGLKPYLQFAQDKLIPLIKSLDENIAATKQPAEIEILNPHNNRYEHHTRFPILNGAGQITHIGGLNIDIDDRVRAKMQLDETRSLLESVFDNIPAELYLREIDGRFVMMNKWGANFYGMKPHETVGKLASQYDTGEEIEIARAAQQKLMMTGRQVTQEYHYKVGDRDVVVLNTIFPIKDSKGNIVRIGGVSTDVTELKNARSQLDEAQSLLKSIFDSVPAVLYLRELDGTFITINNWGATVLGVDDSAEILGSKASSFDSPQEMEEARKAQEQLLKTGMPVTMEYRRKADGHDITVLNTIFPVKDSEGTIVKVGGFAIDVTELYNARSQLQRAQENLHQSEKLAALGQLLAGVAHELNNPLAVVLGRAAILQEKLKDTPHEAPLKKLREAADRCTRIVRTFLAMARQTGPRRQLVEINDMIDSALEMTTYSLRKNNITWNKSLLYSSQKIEVDQDQIVQVLINLILNAQQALEEQSGSRTLNISAELTSDKKWLNIVIADNGPGVPDAIAPRIFDPFFTTKAVGQGTGLGLSVCKSMVESHGGTLQLEPTTGGGATFRLSLPALTALEVNQIHSAEPQSNHDIRGRILIADDEIEIAAILADCLNPLGIECVIVTDGHSAFDQLAKSKFDGIFCDISMPGMDGISFYRKLRETNPNLADHLIFISGDVLHRDWERINSTIDRPILEKPFDPQQVREAALRLLNAEGYQQ